MKNNKIKNALTGGIIAWLAYHTGKVIGREDCLKNILRNNPDMDEVSYNTGKGYVKYFRKKSENEEA